jgi:hypothetical protein
MVTMTILALFISLLSTSTSFPLVPKPLETSRVTILKDYIVWMEGTYDVACYQEVSLQDLSLGRISKRGNGDRKG